MCIIKARHHKLQHVHAQLKKHRNLLFSIAESPSLCLNTDILCTTSKFSIADNCNTTWNENIHDSIHSYINTSEMIKVIVSTIKWLALQLPPNWCSLIVGDRTPIEGTIVDVRDIVQPMMHCQFLYILDRIVHQRQLSCCAKQSNLILESFHGLAGEPCYWNTL